MGCLSGEVATAQAGLEQEASLSMKTRPAEVSNHIDTISSTSTGNVVVFDEVDHLPIAVRSSRAGKM